MSQLKPFKGLLANLRGEIEPGRREYIPKEDALRLLIAHTGQDFGFDIDAWEQWLYQNGKVRSKPKS